MTRVAHQLGIFLIDPRLGPRLLRRGGPDAFAVDVGGKGDIAQLGQFAGPHLDIVAQAGPFVNHEHARPRARHGVVPGQIAFQDLIALLVFDEFALHGGVEWKSQGEKEGG